MAELDSRIILAGAMPDFAETYYKNYDMGRERAAQDSAMQRGNMLAQAKATKPKGASWSDHLGSQGFVDEGMALDKQQGEIDKQKAGLTKEQAESTLKQLEIGGQIQQGLLEVPQGQLTKEAVVRSLDGYVRQGYITPENFETAQKELANVGDDDASIRNLLQQNQAKAVSAKDMLQNHLAQQAQAITMRGQDMTQQTQFRGQDFARENNQVSQGIAKDRLGLDTEYKSAKLGVDRERLDFDKYKALNPKASGGTISEDERKAAGWLAQADNAYKNMLDVLSKDPGADSPGMLETILPESAKGAVQGQARQRYTQAASSFSEAALRAATGAGVNKDEAEQKIRELTPGYFDSAELKKQKAESLGVYLTSLKQRANRAAPEDYQVPTQNGGADGSWTEETIHANPKLEAAAQASGMTVDEYKSALRAKGLLK